MTIEEARNPETLPGRLQEIYQSVGKSDNNRKIRRALVSNPNTPDDILLKLGAEFAQKLLANPKFDLMLQKSPNLLDIDMPEATLISLIRLPELKESYIYSALKKYYCKQSDVLPTIIVDHRQLWDNWRKNNQ